MHIAVTCKGLDLYASACRENIIIELTSNDGERSIEQLQSVEICKRKKFVNDKILFVL